MFQTTQNIQMQAQSILDFFFPLPILTFPAPHATSASKYFLFFSFLVIFFYDALALSKEETVKRLEREEDSVTRKGPIDLYRTPIPQLAIDGLIRTIGDVSEKPLNPLPLTISLQNPSKPLGFRNFH